MPPSGTQPLATPNALCRWNTASFTLHPKTVSSLSASPVVGPRWRTRPWQCHRWCGLAEEIDLAALIATSWHSFPPGHEHRPGVADDDRHLLVAFHWTNQWSGSPPKDLFHKSQKEPAHSTLFAQRLSPSVLFLSPNTCPTPTPPHPNTSPRPGGRESCVEGNEIHRAGAQLVIQLLQLHHRLQRLTTCLTSVSNVDVSPVKR